VGSPTPRTGKTPRGTAKDRALRLLAVRWRSRAELSRRLLLAGFQAEEVEAAIQDLERAGLVDDERFARAVVTDRAGRRLVGDRQVRSVLRQQGVAPDVAEAAMEGAGDESDRALALARKRAVRMSGIDPAVAFRRLFELLVRRGFGPGVAREACRAALAEGPVGFPDEPNPDPA
jgi:regulatory protein